jgi:hypothetical protein
MPFKSLPPTDEFIARARACRRAMEHASDPDLKQVFHAREQHWLFLARHKGGRCEDRSNGAHPKA